MRFQTLLTTCFLSVTLVTGASTGAQQGVEVETKSLDELYELALAEGGNLVIRDGGDEKNQQDAVVNAFKERFPKINLTHTVDFSQYHDSVIDRTLNLTGKAGTDVARLQTVHDFVRWKQEGRLLAYKPAGWEQIPDDIKDPEGAYVSTNYVLFANNFATAKTTKEEAPKEFLDYLDPKWKGKIVSTYPNDDDSVGFQYYKIVQTHGWEVIEKFLAQDIQWVRGSATPIAIMLQNGTRAVSFTTGPGFTDGSAGFFQQLPENDFSHLILWPQRAAIFETAENLAAAKLFLNFLLTKEQQVARGGWSVRNDVPQQDGLKPLSEYAGKLDPPAFEKFMLDRPLVERYKLQWEQLIGTAQGPSPLEDDL